jgi:hypothetical protein
MTVREAVNAMYRYLREEQRTIPFAGGTYEDPLPDALQALNGGLQVLSVETPLFAAKQQRSAFFRAPADVAVTDLAVGGYTATGTFPAHMAGCWIDLPGDSQTNRILSIVETTANLQFPYLGSLTSGTANVKFDAAELPQDVITVLEPVRYRNTNVKLQACGSRHELANPGSQTRYFIESAIANRLVKLRMMLSGYPTEDTVIEFQARTSLGSVSAADVYDAGDPDADPGVALPVPADFVESIFLPIATDIFFSTPAITNYDVSELRNEDAPKLVRERAGRAFEMLAKMHPQGNKRTKFVPGWLLPTAYRFPRFGW